MVDGFLVRPTHRIPPPLSTTSLAAVVDVSELTYFYQSQPYMAAFLTCSTKAGAADYIAQVSNNNSTDVGRNLAFMLYGGLYQGLCQQFMYVNLYPSWFGTTGSPTSVLSQLVVELGIVGPLLCLPLAYVSKSLINATGIEEGLSKYIHDVQHQDLLTKYWSLWVPVNVFTFGVVPLYFRVAFVAAVSFFWIICLSMVAGNEATTIRNE